MGSIRHDDDLLPTKFNQFGTSSKFGLENPFQFFNLLQPVRYYPTTSSGKASVYHYPVSPEKPLNNPTHSTNPSPSLLPQTLAKHHQRRVVRFVGYNCSFLVTPLGPILFSTAHNISAREILGIFIKASPAHCQIIFRETARCSRIAVREVLCLRVLPFPCHDRFAHFIMNTDVRPD